MTNGRTVLFAVGLGLYDKRFCVYIPDLLYGLMNDLLLRTPFVEMHREI